MVRAVNASTQAQGRELSTLSALGNPLRLRMLSILTADSRTATEMARELGISHASASYHLRQLEQAGLVVAEEGKIVRGGRERRYRQRVLRNEHEPHETWIEADLRMVIEALHTELVRRAKSHIPGSNAVVDGEFWVASETWEQAQAQILAAGRLLHDAALPARTPGTAHVNLTALLFQIGDDVQASDNP